MIYLSGIPQFNRQDVGVRLKFDSDIVTITLDLLFGKNSVKIQKEDLISVQEKTEEQISKDVTLTRLLAFGIFAFGLKKKRRSKEKYLILTYIDSGQQMTAVFKDHSPSEFRKLFNAVKEGQEIRDSKTASVTIPADVSSGSVLEQLSNLNDLRKEGAITEEEYSRLKAQILNK